jgi:hypothetical protein
MVSPTTIVYVIGVGVGGGGLVGEAISIGVCDEISLGVGLEYGINDKFGVIEGDGDTSCGTQPANRIIRTKFPNITPINERSRKNIDEIITQRHTLQMYLASPCCLVWTALLC